MIPTYLGIYLLGLGISFVLALFCSTHCSKRTIFILTRILFFLSILYGFCIVWTSLVSYENFSEYIDLSYYHSFLKQLASGSLPLIWDTGVPVWSQHISPFLFLFVPLYLLGAHANILVFLQAVAAVGASIPLYLFTKHTTKTSFLAICIVLGYLVSGSIQTSLYYGFHEVTFFPLLFFSTLYLWSKKRYWAYIIVLILTLFLKEEISFYGIVLGVYMLFRRDIKYGISTMILSFGWYLLSFWILSYFHHGGYEYWGQFLGGTAYGGIWGIFVYILIHPIETIQYIFLEERKVLMLIESFGSIGFIPFMYPPGLFLLIPALSMKLLSGDITMMNSFHYSATYIGVLFGATVLAIRRRIQPSRYVAVGIFFLGMSLIGSYFYGYGYYYGSFPKMTLSNIKLHNFFLDNRSAIRNSMIRSIPKEASVGCQYQICSHIKRPYGMIYPIPGSQLPTYMIFDAELPFPLKDTMEVKQFFTETVPTKYCPRQVIDGIYLLKRCYLKEVPQ